MNKSPTNPWEYLGLLAGLLAGFLANPLLDHVPADREITGGLLVIALFMAIVFVSTWDWRQRAIRAAGEVAPVGLMLGFFIYLLIT